MAIIPCKDQSICKLMPNLCIKLFNKLRSKLKSTREINQSANISSVTSACLKGNTLPTILHTFGNLKVLTVRSLFGSYEVDIAFILNNCHELRELTILHAEKLKFSNMQGGDMSVLREDKEEIYTLKKFICKSSEGMNDEILEMLAKTCPKLWYLDLEGCSNVTGKGLKDIIKHCKHLKDVNLDWCINVDINSVNLMINSCPFLRKIVTPNPLDHTVQEIKKFQKQGCVVVPGTWEVDYYWYY